MKLIRNIKIYKWMKAILTYFYYIISDSAKMWKLPITLAVLCIAGNLCNIDLLPIGLK